jgi:hypothetical protein
VIGVGIFGAILTAQSSGPHFSYSEQSFLTEIKNSAPSPCDTTPGGGAWISWPSDSELVYEAHVVCMALTDFHGSWDKVEYYPTDSDTEF